MPEAHSAAPAASDAIFQPLRLHGIALRNRVLRSSIGGRTCNYDGSVTDVWKNFERRFADGDVGAVISTTFHVNAQRLSPLQYPSIAQDRYVPVLRKYIAQIKESGAGYIMQIGDPGYATYSSLLPEPDDSLSASDGFDLAFGYGNRRRAMTGTQIERSIAEYAEAARRAREAGVDGIEITIAKGYLIHQFLNPAINRRDDDWGGDARKRFRFLEEIMRAVRKAVGDDFLVGIRLSGADYNTSPLALALLRWPPVVMSREYRVGNGIERMRDYAQQLERLGAGYFHVTSGYGFPNPHDVPGEFPVPEIRMFFDSVRHLSGKAAVRAAVAHAIPAPIVGRLLSAPFVKFKPVNLELAREIRSAVKVPVIANGGFQKYADVHDALATGACDGVSMARALIANTDLLPRYFRHRTDPPAKKLCTQCNRCVGRTTTSPLGCYEPDRFDTPEDMLDEIFRFNRSDGV